MWEPLDDRRRLAYLRALGIDLWVPRGPVSAPPFAASLQGEASAGTPDAGPRPRTEAVVPSRPVGREQASQVGARVETPASSAPALPDLAPPVSPPHGMDWDALAATVASCRACSLWETRTQTVFGVGDRAADLLVIGEAPGADEDREGEPFVGRAGRLLTQMLAAIGLTRGQVYIANILKCRPPGNRDPRPDEVAHCQGFLQRQVDLIAPRAILSVGRISAQTLLGTDTPVGRLRGRWLAYGRDEIPLRVTYHPAYLLRSPDQKAKAWEDLTAVARKLSA